ncbi:MAG: hypothetical protein J3Q66DRAFT_328736 [Benniella sp.]|nr:MAG: hypothetical protein J3Q66DRAFT_328736 [Benniella sp.]
MKFTSVLLALSAVVAMVQAVPLSKRDVEGDVQGDAGYNGLVVIGHVPIDLRKRFVDSILERVPISGISKRDLVQSIPTDVSAIQNLINGLVDPVQVTLATLVQIAVDAHFHLNLGIANVVEAHVEIQAAIQTAIGVAVTENLTGLDDTIKSLVNNAVTTAWTVDIDALATQAIDLIHDRVAEVVVQVNASILADIYAKIMALGLVQITVAVDLDAKLGLDVDMVVGRLLGDLPTIKQRLVENLVQ